MPFESGSASTSRSSVSCIASKEKALAEVAALLVLQKNFQALLEGADK